jgi:hypothetical protein
MIDFDDVVLIDSTGLIVMSSGISDERIPIKYSLGIVVW